MMRRNILLAHMLFLGCIFVSIHADVDYHTHIGPLIDFGGVRSQGVFCSISTPHYERIYMAGGVQSTDNVDPFSVFNDHFLQQSPYNATASSSWGDTDSWRFHAPMDATGSREVYFCADHPYAWTPLNKDSAPEWLETVYDVPVHATEIVVWESLNEGSVFKVEVGFVSGGYVTVWEGTDTATCLEGFFVTFDEPTEQPVNRVRIHTSHPHWEMIDTISLKGVTREGRLSAGAIPAAYAPIAFLDSYMCSDPAGRELYLWGGWEESHAAVSAALDRYSMHTEEWDMLYFDWEGIAWTSGKCVVEDNKDRHRIVYFMGEFAETTFRYFDIDDRTWHEGSAFEAESTPSLRQFYAVQTVGTTVFLFGGSLPADDSSGTGSTTYFGELWMFDLTSDTWHLPDYTGDGPPSMEDPKMQYYPGYPHDQVPTDSSPAPTAPTSAMAPMGESVGGRRSGSGSGASSGSGSEPPGQFTGMLVVFGGYRADEGVEFDRVWVLDLERLQWREIRAAEAPMKYGSSRLHFHGLRDDTIFFHGPIVDNNDNVPGDTAYAFTLNLTSWVWDRVPMIPRARKSHTLATIDGGVYLFGGCNAGTCLNDLWRGLVKDEYDLLATPWIDWSQCDPQNPPPPREGAAHAVVGSWLIIFGGCADVTLDDMWRIDVKATPMAWEKLTFQSTDHPPARMHALLEVAQLEVLSLLLFGGSTGTGGQTMNDVWLLDFVEQSWRLLTPCAGRVSLLPRLPSWGMMYSDGTGVAFVVAGGLGDDGNLLEDMWMFDLHDQCWREIDISGWESPGGTYVGLYGHAASAVLGKDIVVLGGLSSIEFKPSVILSPWVSVISVWRDSSMNDTLVLKASFRVLGRESEGRTASAATLTPAGNVVYIGGGHTHGPYSQHILNDAGYIRLEPKCNSTNGDTDGCFACPQGYWQGDDGQCRLCEEGYINPFSKVGRCLACPKGFYGLGTGGSSMVNCKMCPNGTFLNDSSPEPGEPPCAPCEGDSFCFTGSTVPMPSTHADSWFIEGHPEALTDETEEARRRSTDVTATLLFSSLALAMGLGILWLAHSKEPPHYFGSSARRLRNASSNRIHSLGHYATSLLRQMDMFRGRHVDRPALSSIENTWLAVRFKTTFGGYMSYLWFATLCLVAFNVIYPFYHANTRETRAVRPDTSGDVDIAAGITTTLRVEGMGVPCSYTVHGEYGHHTGCLPTVEVDVSGVSTDGHISCLYVDGNSTAARYCEVTWECASCYFTTRSSFAFNFTDVFASAYALRLHAEATSGLPEQNSFFERRLLVQHPEGGLFHGLQPTVMMGYALPTVYENDLNNTAGNGYHLIYDGSLVGSVADHYNFSATTQLFVRLELELEPNMLEVHRFERLTELQLLTSLFGSMTGLWGMYAVAMVGVEVVRKMLGRTGVVAPVDSRFQSVEIVHAHVEVEEEPLPHSSTLDGVGCLGPPGGSPHRGRGRTKSKEVLLLDVPKSG
eukprot:Rmarinus@m.9181